LAHERAARDLASGCIYVEETNRIEGEKTVGLKARPLLGYSLKLPTRDSENVSVKVDDAVDNSQDSQT